ncbi:proteasome activator complex subunit 4 [Clonorchis sinensis]|uniref:Proteasome activator complex subunit 4 n=1 Tax=Clonorchis sinensis TaxID=79923 RepID=G7YNU2_CLOSI|nr:proteasome activator complex subunit 4 [Clonorchis sinensis]
MCYYCNANLHPLPTGGVNSKVKKPFTRYSDRLLPIPSTQLNQYLDAEWAFLKERLCQVLSSGDVICQLPVILDSIHRYIIINGLRFPKSEQVALLRFSLSLVCCPSLDFVVSMAGLGLASAILKYFWSLPIKSVELNWRHFHELIDWLSISPEARANLLPWGQRNVGSLVDLIRVVKTFFPVSSIEEIWMKYRHEIASRMLESFDRPASNKFYMFTPFHPNAFDTINRTWLPSVFDFWYLIPDFGPRFQDVIRLFALLARNCRGCVDWEPHLERVFCGLLRSMTLPNGPSAFADEHAATKPLVFHHYATLLINAIGPDRADCPSTVIPRLEKFYKAVTHFCHPSNTSKSAAFLILFTRRLVMALYQRLRSELFPHAKQVAHFGSPPAEYNLSVSQVDRLVDLLVPITVDYMLFSNLDCHLLTILHSIDFLARMRPRAVMPKLLASLEDGVSRPEAPLRYSRPLSALILSVASFSHVRFPVFQHGSMGNADVESREAHQDAFAEQPEEHEEDELQVGDSEESIELDTNSADEMIREPDSSEMNNKKRQSAKFEPTMSPPDKAHLAAFLYPEGRCQLMRLMNSLIPGFDPDYPDRFAATMACYSRLFLSVPIQDYPVSASDELEESGLDQMEEVVTNVFARILEHLQFANDRSCVSHNVSNGESSMRTVTGDGKFIHRPHTAPEGRPRVPMESAILSNLTGLAVTMAISAGPNPVFRQRLLRLLVDAIFAAQWEPDTARLLAYQLYWFSVNSRQSVISLQTLRDTESPETCLDTALFALELIWPRFMQLVEEVDSDQFFVYRGRVEPRLLALLYILPGSFSALHPSRLLEPSFFQRYLVPLLHLLSKLLYMSTGVSVITANIDWWLDEPTNHHMKDQSVCPALAEAASALLATLLRRLTTCSVDLTNFDLMATGSTSSSPETLFLTSNWWTPFISSRTMFELSQTFPARINNCTSSNRIAPFWVVPCTMQKEFAKQLVGIFLEPVIRRLGEIASRLSPVSGTTHMSGFEPGLSLSTQRDQLSALLIWLNNVLTGIADDLAPRMPDFAAQEQVYLTNQPISQPDFTSTFANLPFFDCVLPDDTGKPSGLRELVFTLGLNLLDKITELFRQADDSLSSADIAHPENQEDTNDSAPTAPTQPSNSVGQLLNLSQIADLLSLIQTTGFNLGSNENYPCLLRTSRGPVGLYGKSLGAAACLRTLEINLKGIVLIPGIQQLCGSPCATDSQFFPFHCGSRLELPIRKGCSLLTWLATIQRRYLRLQSKRLQYPLTFAASGLTAPNGCDECLVPTPLIRRLVQTMGVLATAPRRSDIRHCVSHQLTSNVLPKVAQVTAELASAMVDRLEDAVTDVEQQAVDAHLLPGPNETVVARLREAKFKLVTHRRRTCIKLLSDLFHRISQTHQDDEFVRLDPSIPARMWVAISAQAIHTSQVEEDPSTNQTLTPAERRYRHTAQDQLEKLVLEVYGKASIFPMRFLLHFPTQRDQIPSSSWLARVYDEVENLLIAFHSPRTASLSQTNPEILQVITKRRIVCQRFLSDLLDRCLSKCEAILVSRGSESTRGTAGQALVARLLSLLPRHVDPPLTPSWLPHSILLAPPPPPPPLALLSTAVHLVLSHQPEVAEAACNYLQDMLFLLLLRHRSCPVVLRHPVQIAEQKLGTSVVQYDPPVPCPRPDNIFLLFDPDARILATDESYRNHHHLPTANIGFTYLPTEVYSKDPFYEPAYPVFSPDNGELDVSKADWLDHLDTTDENGQLTRDCLCFLARNLASPTAEVGKFWLTLADRLLHLHRRPSKRLFPISSFLRVCALSFGPNPFVHHAEAFFHALLPICPDGLVRKFDGLTEVVGPAWFRHGLVEFTIGTLNWPRTWRYYYLGRVLPRLMATYERNALTVTTVGLAQTAAGQVHPALLDDIGASLSYASSYSGVGSCEQASTFQSDFKQLPVQEHSKEDRPVLGPHDTVSQSQAGGPLDRLAFFSPILFSCLCHFEGLDINTLHPLWDWIQSGILDCARKLNGFTVPADSGATCGHSPVVKAPMESAVQSKDECPVCMLNRCMPLAHRRVFYAHLCVTFIICLGWKASKLFPYLSTCLPFKVDPKNHDGASQAQLTWFQKACDNSVWIRDLAADIAVFRASVECDDIFYARRVPVNLLPFRKTEKLNNVSSRIETLTELRLFWWSACSQLNDVEPIGHQFVSNVFLPHLIRDTLTVLRLKGYQSSTKSCPLPSLEPQCADYSRPYSEGDLLEKSGREKCVEVRPLTNRLRCIYAAVPALLSWAFPVAPQIHSNQDPDNASMLHFLIALTPLLADVCSTGNLYKRISHQLAMGTFGSAGFARTPSDGVGDEHVDGLESGAELLLSRFSLIPLCGNAEPEIAAKACLDITHHFLKHSSWKTRGVGLLLLRNLVIMNLPSFWTLEHQKGRSTENGLNAASFFQRIRQSFVNLLADPWVEVCHLAMCALAVLIQMGALKFEEEWVEELIRKTKTPYSRRNWSNPSTEDATAYQSAIRERHAGVLGLAAFVHAYPYTTPEFLPRIITELAVHVHDPQPIEKTVRDSLSSYSRSHQDTWHEQKQMFTDEQLEEYLSVVSAAAYYI